MRWACRWNHLTIIVARRQHGSVLPMLADIGRAFTSQLRGRPTGADHRLDSRLAAGVCGQRCAFLKIDVQVRSGVIAEWRFNGARPCASACGSAFSRRYIRRACSSAGAHDLRGFVRGTLSGLQPVRPRNGQMCGPMNSLFPGRRDATRRRVNLFCDIRVKTFSRIDCVGVGRRPRR